VKSELEVSNASRDIELRVQQTARVNFHARMGVLSETAIVTGVSPLVETANATIGTSSRTNASSSCQLNAGNYLQLVALSPNVSAAVATRGRRAAARADRAPTQLSNFGAAPAEFNYYTLDGVDNTTSTSTPISSTVGRRSLEEIQGADGRVLRRITAVRRAR